MSDGENIDIAEFVSDYVTIIADNGERMPSRKKLADEIALALAERGCTATANEVMYYL